MKSVKYEVKDAVGTLTLCRPDKLNALTFEVYRELTDFFAAPQEARVIVITGEGRGFCSGGDVNEIIGPLLKMNSEQLLQFTKMTCDLIKNIRTCRRPVVAAVNGTCAGAGAVIASACDIRYASDKAKFAFLFTKVGLSGADMGAAYLLPRIVGFGRASELLMTGAFIDAAEAYRIGLVNAVVPHDRLQDEVRRLAVSLSKGPALGLSVTKEMLNRELHAALEQALEWEADVQARCMQTPDFKEAFQAFVEKREPRFQ
jgi:enoyl-CoA hydratase/carnithine racemase